MSLAKNDYLIETLHRKLWSLEKGERIYNFWKMNSQVNVHWRNVCHLVKITVNNLTQETKDISDQSIEKTETKMYKTTWSQEENRDLYKNYFRLYGSNISFGSFINAKPFGITRPTEK